jgi:hypothetical protein
MSRKRMMSVGKRAAPLVVLLFNVGAGSFTSRDVLRRVTLMAQAQPLRNLIARLRGETLPDSNVKSNGRLEATTVDVLLQISQPVLRSDGGGALQHHTGAGRAKITSP